MQVVSATMNEQGRVVIPAPIRRAMGLDQPVELLFRLEDGRLVVETLEGAVAQAQKAAAGYRPAGRSLVDDLIAERRAEAASS